MRRLLRTKPKHQALCDHLLRERFVLVSWGAIVGGLVSELAGNVTSRLFKQSYEGRHGIPPSWCDNRSLRKVEHMRYVPVLTSLILSHCSSDFVKPIIRTYRPLVKVGKSKPSPTPSAVPGVLLPSNDSTYVGGVIAAVYTANSLTSLDVSLLL